MSRDLPPRPNLEFLKKQAKELLRDMQQSTPDGKLADAQHALARDYGFASWPALHAHVAAVTSAAATHPLAGRWRWTALPSTPDSSEPYRSVTLQFEVDHDAVTICDVTVDTQGQEHRNENTVLADGSEYAQPHGYSITTRWDGARALEAVGKKDGRVEGRVRYEVSADGRTLTLSANDRVLQLVRTLT